MVMEMAIMVATALKIMMIKRKSKRKGPMPKMWELQMGK
jgi:hypothetical protein